MPATPRPPTPTSTPSRPTSTGPTTTWPPCATGRNGPPTSPSPALATTVDSAIAQAHLRHRHRSLDTDVAGLAFGRLDDEDGDTWYVGRRHVEDERSDPVVVDWRAPVSTPFYRATAADPLGLRRRRRFVMTGRQLDDLFDEVFDDPDSVDAAHHGGIPDPLLAELERSRTGEMRDIVATIAAEQDVIIRAPLDTVPRRAGRARARARRRSACTGPPSSSTSTARSSTARACWSSARTPCSCATSPRCSRRSARPRPARPRSSGWSAASVGRVRAFDTPAVARLKGDARMALVLAAAARDHLRPPAAGPARTTSGCRRRGGRCGCRRPPSAAAVDEVLGPGRPLRHRPDRVPDRAWPGSPARPTWRSAARRTPSRPTPSRPPGGRTPRRTPWPARCGRRCPPRRW